MAAEAEAEVEVAMPVAEVAVAAEEKPTVGVAGDRAEVVVETAVRWTPCS